MSALGSSQVSPATPAGRIAVEAVPPPGDRSGSAGAPFGLRLKVRLTRGRLDRRIAAGDIGEASEELALRVRQLADPRSQQELARGLRGVLAYVDQRGTGPVISSVVIEPRAVRYGRRAIIELAERLERGGPVDPRGIVLARALLGDGLSPLFNPRSEQTVTDAVRDVLDGLGEDSAIVALAA
jgi:hypothetical protein